MKQYRVISPIVVVKYKDPDTQLDVERTLRKGEVASLPEDDVNIRALVARRQIVEIPPHPEPPADDKKPAKQ